MKMDHKHTFQLKFFVNLIIASGKPKLQIAKRQPNPRQFLSLHALIRNKDFRVRKAGAFYFILSTWQLTILDLAQRAHPLASDALNFAESPDT
jgi:hypothetical protein